jgi:hypothetical protein
MRGCPAGSTPPFSTSTGTRVTRMPRRAAKDVRRDLDHLLPDDEVKAELARRNPYGEWLHDRVVHIEDLPEKSPRVPRVEPLRAKQLAFGWTEEDLRVILAPMARDAAEPTGSMGNDVALASLSDRKPPLFSYFKQLFAQVTNPAIDPIRESVVMSLTACIGPEINLLDETPDHCHQLVMSQPILRNSQLEKLRQVDHRVFEARTIDMTWPAAEGEAGMERRVEEICREASRLVARGVNIIILSDRRASARHGTSAARTARARRGCSWSRGAGRVGFLSGRLAVCLLPLGEWYAANTGWSFPSHYPHSHIAIRQRT